MKKPKNIDHDTLWKMVITRLFKQFLAFGLPEVYADADFSVESEFLEQELPKLVADGKKKGKRISDKLVKLRLKVGKDIWLFIHVEVQSTFETDFNQRMHTYFYRILDKIPHKLTAIALYTTQEIPRQYDRYQYECYGVINDFKFNTNSKFFTLNL